MKAGERKEKAGEEGEDSEMREKTGGGGQSQVEEGEGIGVEEKSSHHYM